MKIINSKIFKIIIVLFIIGFLLGILFYYKVGSKDEIEYYFNSINNREFNYSKNLILAITYNLKYIILIWVSGIFIFLSIIIPFIIIYRGIINGFIFISIIHLFHIKGLLIALILAFPVILINESILFLISYYSLNFSIRTYNIIKDNKSINLKLYTKNYYYKFIIFFIVIILNCLFETFITSNIIRYVL